ncbi:MAG: VWA domain-containing protein [Terriglobales bacterium]
MTGAAAGFEKKAGCDTKTAILRLLLPIVLACLTLTSSFGLSQNQQQPLPDAPSAQKPSQTLPSAPAPQIPPESAPARSAPPPPSTVQNPAPSPVTTVPEGGATPMPGSERDRLFTLTKNVNFVVVPVTVKDPSGHLVAGLTSKDFTVLEDNESQKITFFTSDPFPLSAAVVIDEGVPDVTFAKIRNTVASLVGAFGQFDEVSIYTYNNVVSKMQDFTAIGEHLNRAADRLKDRRGEEGGGVPINSGPMATGCPMINGHCIDPGAPITGRAGTPDMHVSHVLNDAVLAAAVDLSHRPADRRKIIFIISDGHESGSSASYSQVLKVLLSNQIQVYGIGVSSAAIPLYGQLEKIHVPGTGFGDILPRYAAATGGQVFDALTQDAIERAYSRITEEARNQYTIGYVTRATPSSSYRPIEVRVDRPDLNIIAKYGYYPAPPVRTAH